MRFNPWYLLLAVLAAGLFYLFSQTLERYEEPVDMGWSEDARRNPFLAAEQFLDNRSMAVESSDRLDVLDRLTRDSTLVISNANHVLSRQRAADLVDWMESGGHVVVAAQVLSEDEPDVLLSYFEISKHPVDETTDEQPEGSDDSEQKSDPNQSLREALEQVGEDTRREQEDKRLRSEAVKQEWNVAETTRHREALSSPENLMPLSFEGLDYVLEADFSGGGSLSHPALYLEEGEEYSGYQPFYWAGNEQAIGFMQMDVGEGLLTVMADLNLWTSSQINLFDHAYLLQLMTDSSDQVIFLYGALVPSLFDLLWRHFYELMIALLALMAAWLVYRTRRFGPVAEFSTTGRRSFGEHIQAVGNFLWQEKMADRLVNAVRRDIWHGLQKSYPGSERFSEEDKLRKLTEVSGMDADRVRTLMLGKPSAEEIRFYYHIRSLQQIRKAL